MKGGSGSSFPRGEARFWAAALIVFMLLVWTGIRWIPPCAPASPELRPIEISAQVVPLTFTQQLPLDLNRALAEELTELPGIGPVLAERIVAWREANGPFKSVGDLLLIPGIGVETLARIRDRVTVGRP